MTNTISVIHVVRYLKTHDPVMKKVIRLAKPLSMHLDHDPFTLICQSIVGQQLSSKAADTIWARVKKLYPRRRFLRPKEIAATRDESFRICGLSRMKVSFIKGLADAFIEGSVKPKLFSAMLNEEVIANLTRVKGIGRWTAEMFLIFGLGRLDVLPVDDLGLQKAIQRAYGLKALPSEAHIRRIARKWGPYTTIATRYLWRYADMKV